MELHQDRGWRLGSLSLSIPSPGWGVTTGGLPQQRGSPVGAVTFAPPTRVLEDWPAIGEDAQRFAQGSALLNLMKAQAGRPSLVI